MAEITPSPTLSSPGSEGPDPASQLEEEEGLEYEEEEEDRSQEHPCCVARSDPFHDRSPLFNVVGRFVRSAQSMLGSNQLFQSDAPKCTVTVPIDVL